MLTFFHHVQYTMIVASAHHFHSFFIWYNITVGLLHTFLPKNNHSPSPPSPPKSPTIADEYFYKINYHQKATQHDWFTFNREEYKSMKPGNPITRQNSIHTQNEQQQFTKKLLIDILFSNCLFLLLLLPHPIHAHIILQR